MNKRLLSDSTRLVAAWLIRFTCFGGGTLVGWFAGVFIYTRLDFSGWHLGRRSCPEGWFAVFTAFALVTLGVILIKKRQSLIAVAAIAGFGVGIAAFGGFDIWLTNILPSC